MSLEAGAAIVGAIVTVGSIIIALAMSVRDAKTALKLAQDEAKQVQDHAVRIAVIETRLSQFDARLKEIASGVEYIKKNMLSKANNP